VGYRISLNSLYPYTSLIARGQVSDLYRTEDKIIAFCVLDMWWKNRRPWTEWNFGILQY